MTYTIWQVAWFVNTPVRRKWDVEEFGFLINDLSKYFDSFPIAKFIPDVCETSTRNSLHDHVLRAYRVVRICRVSVNQRRRNIMSSDEIHSCYFAGGCEELRLRRRVRETSNDPEAIVHSHFKHPIEASLAQFAEGLYVLLLSVDGFGRSCKESRYIECQASFVKSSLLVVSIIQ